MKIKKANQLLVRRLLCFSVLLLLTACAANNRPLQLISGEGPRYPQQAREQGIEGEVTVAYEVDSSGRVLNTRVVSSRPAGLFDEAALAAVRSWRFNAPIIDGVVQQTTQRQSTVTFRLGGTREYDTY
jgi:periplasmic protein TonB